MYIDIVQCNPLLNWGHFFYARPDVSSQDPLEWYFSHQRHRSGSNDNPTVEQVPLNVHDDIGATATSVQGPENTNVKQGNSEDIPVYCHAATSKVPKKALSKLT